MVGAFGFFSEYNLLKSVFRLKDIIKHAKQENYPFIALNDTNNLYGSYKLFKYAKMKYILGMKLSLIDDEILVYALNEEGYKHLNILSSMVMLSDTKKLSFEEVIPFQEGLYFISSGFYSSINESIMRNQFDLAKDKILYYQSKVTYFSLGLTLQTLEEEIVIAPKLQALAKECGVLLLPLNFMSYLKEDEEAFDTLIQVQNTYNRAQRDESFLTKEQLKIRFSDYPEVFKNLETVMSLFTFEYEQIQYHLPTFTNNKQIILDLCMNKLKQKKLTTTPYVTRLNYELSVINDMGFNDYFLIVYDFVKYAKDKQILVGPGRGSSAGSLVSYLLGITNIDPLKHGLLFERFLNKERHSMPDIDLDFPDNKRDEVILYVKEKYGSNHVVSINTFARFAEKSSIRDIAKIKGYSSFEINHVVKKIQSGDKLDHTLSQIVELSKKFEGLPRQTGTHAAGVILAKEDLRYYIPMQQGPLMYQSQLEHEDLEGMGLLKIDFLGLKNLTIIDEVLKLIKEHKARDIDLETIPLDDKKTYALLKEEDTLGIFQLESQGMRSVLRKLKPQEFNDIVALLALYRPGPMQNIDEYIERRNGKKFTYIHESLTDILKETYGIIIYQEQIMQIAQQFSGYTLEEADLLRVGISKKDHAILEHQKERFIKKSIENNQDKQLAEEIYNYILKFADYGFNKSHSVAYSTVSYHMAYLKANYYDLFMSVLLSNTISQDQQTYQMITDLRNRGYRVLAPNVNISTAIYEHTEEGLIFPLTGIKNIGSTIANKIIEERKQGLFKNYDDFKNRLKDINKRTLEGLIFSGALDVFGLNKKELFETMDTEVSLYQSVVTDIIPIHYEEFEMNTLIEKEKEAIGFNLSNSPIDVYRELMKKQNIKQISQVSFSNVSEKALGVLKKVKVIKTKKNEEMAFISLSDGLATIEATVFPEIYAKYKESLTPNDVCVVHLKLNEYQGKKWIVEYIDRI